MECGGYKPNLFDCDAERTIRVCYDSNAAGRDVAAVEILIRRIAWGVT
jgi:hypothetical protein